MLKNSTLLRFSGLFHGWGRGRFGSENFLRRAGRNNWRSVGDLQHGFGSASFVCGFGFVGRGQGGVSTVPRRLLGSRHLDFSS